MQGRIFSRDYKLEAVKLVRERGALLPRRPGTAMSTRMCCANGFGNVATIPASPFLEKDR